MAHFFGKGLHFWVFNQDHFKNQIFGYSKELNLEFHVRVTHDKFEVERFTFQKNGLRTRGTFSLIICHKFHRLNICLR